MSNTHQPDAGKTPADRKLPHLKQGPRDENLDQPIGDPASPDGDEELDQPIGDPPAPDGDNDNDENDEPGRKPGDVQNDEHDEEIGKPIPHKV